MGRKERNGKLSGGDSLCRQKEFAASPVWIHMYTGGSGVAG